MNNEGKNQSEPRNSNELKAIFEEDHELALFFITCLQNDLNATKSYQVLHPKANYHSCRTLGSRMLSQIWAKVDISILLESYNLGYDRVLKQLDEGLNSTKIDPVTQKEIPDHKTRFLYFQSHASLLGLEIKSNPKVSSEEAWRNVEILPSSWYKSDVTTNPENQNGQDETNANAVAK